ncbi:MAG: hypothetical protein ACPGU4_10910 [Flavobacteriales bacterium]
MAILLCPNSANAQQETVDVFFKLLTPDSDYKAIEITVLKNGKRSKVFSPPRRRVKLKLNYNAEYMLTFKSDSCKPKEIYINTKNVPKHMTLESLEVAFEVELSKAFQFNDEPYLNSPRVTWFYHADEGVFAYEIENFPAAHLEASSYNEQNADVEKAELD